MLWNPLFIGLSQCSKHQITTSRRHLLCFCYSVFSFPLSVGFSSKVPLLLSNFTAFNQYLGLKMVHPHRRFFHPHRFGNIFRPKNVTFLYGFMTFITAFIKCYHPYFQRFMPLCGVVTYTL